MRISDWSSDVCSSDLGARARSGFGSEDHPPPSKYSAVSSLHLGEWLNSLARTRPSAPCCENAATPRVAARRKRSTECTALRIRAPLTVPRRSGKGSNRAGEPRDKKRGPRPRGRHRSEEHTSELQSLMRTSYAVFCLQKKTTHP